MKIDDQKVWVSIFIYFHWFSLLFIFLVLFKVAEHSFRARFCWRDSARAQGLQKQTCRQ